jgi:hypothetical protein
MNEDVISRMISISSSITASPHVAGTAVVCGRRRSNRARSLLPQLLPWAFPSQILGGSKQIFRIFHNNLAGRSGEI